jgi:hypothetical protein
MAEPRSGAGLGAYLKEAFLFRWNLLAFAGGVAAAALSPVADVLLPLVGAAEAAYLAGLISIPRFRAAIDAKYGARASAPAPGRARAPAIATLLLNLSPRARKRFEDLRSRCLQMRAIARGVRGRSGASGAPDEFHTPALDRMLWVFLRLLHSQDSLAHFLRSTEEPALVERLEETRRRLAGAQERQDERIARSLQDSLATAELRLENYRKAEQNAHFVAVELDRIEQKIHALNEAAVNRQDPDFISSQVDSVAESMRQTEKAIGELQAITGLVEELEEPPAILEADLEEVLQR